MNVERPDVGPTRSRLDATRPVRSDLLPVYESASIMWSFAAGGQSAMSTDSGPPVIPEAEPQARVSGTWCRESNLTRSRLEALLAFGSHRSGRDDGC
jgi:hypothetical protein